jgi:hypothetical protein
MFEVFIVLIYKTMSVIANRLGPNTNSTGLYSRTGHYRLDGNGVGDKFLNKFKSYSKTYGPYIADLLAQNLLPRAAQAAKDELGDDAPGFVSDLIDQGVKIGQGSASQFKGAAKPPGHKQIESASSKLLEKLLGGEGIRNLGGRGIRNLGGSGIRNLGGNGIRNLGGSVQLPLQ